MSGIKLVMLEQYQIMYDGIKSLISDVHDVDVIERARDFNDLHNKIHALMSFTNVDVVLINLHVHTEDAFDDIKKLREVFPRIKVLLMLFRADERNVLLSIKTGIKGILHNDTNRSELLEAIYTVQNGYDYLGKSITNLVLQSYLQEHQEFPKKANGSSELSDREMDVLKLFGEGYTNKEIADQLFISVRTVETHKNNIMKKINLRTTVDLVKFAIRNNIIKI